MLPTAGGKPFSSPDWIFEPRFDGYRCLARFGAGAVELRTRSGLDCTSWFPELCESLAPVVGGPYIIDGEACVLDNEGRSNFDRLRERTWRHGRIPGCDTATWCAFDLLAEGGRSLMGLPLFERKSRLTKLLAGLAPARVLLVQHSPADAALLESAEPPLRMDGFVAKRLGSIYKPGVRSSDWLKVHAPGVAAPSRATRKEPLRRRRSAS
jgi:bifunctional non-homologous end joining protein LigD